MYNAVIQQGAATTMISVSASMIVRNEEKGIASAIRSLDTVKAIDEVVVVDTGSADRTIEIAKNLGAVVHEDTWRDDFSYHRNQCLDLCSNDWVFILDGDEELADPGDLDVLFRKPVGDAIAVKVDCVGGTGKLGESFVAVRAFNRRVGRWKYPVHNQIVGIRHVVPSTAKIVARYDGDTVENTRARLAVFLEHAEKNPDEPHYAFFLGKMYRALYDFANTRRWAEKYLSFNLEEPREAEVWILLIEAAFMEGNVAEAYSLMEKAIHRHPTYPDLHYFQLAFAALQWHNSVSQPDPKYLTSACRSRQYASLLPEVVELLGLPLGFEDDGTA